MEEKIYTDKEIEEMKGVNWSCGYCWMVHGVSIPEREHTAEHFKLYPLLKRIKIYFWRWKDRRALKNLMK